MNIFLDIEAIPGQALGLKEEIAKEIKPPANYSKAETIAKWEIETKPLLVEEAWRKTALHGDRGELICIGWAINYNEPEVVYRSLNESEADLLLRFFNAVSKALEVTRGRQPCWIGHHVRDYDLRFMYQRAVILMLRPPFRLPHDARPGSEAVFDTMTAWAGWGGRISQARLCIALGLPSKGSEIGEEIDGSMIWDMVRMGRIKDVATYCKGDVSRVQLIHQRMSFL